MAQKNNDFRNGLIVITSIVMAYVVYTQFITFPISQEFVSWEQSGSEVSTAKVGVPVTLNLNIYSTSLLGYNGQIKVDIKKDVILGTDSVVTTKTISVNIPMGQNQKQSVSVTFTPTENAGGGP